MKCLPGFFRQFNLLLSVIDTISPAEITASDYSQLYTTACFQNYIVQ